MLQQTVVATVEPYFERFVARFPDFAALAAAREDEVTALWSGLGYYARARNLRRAAIAVVAEHGGVLPDDEETLRTLPGVGPYTAAAVAAIAFDRRAFALDGNGIRVLARLFAVREPVNLPATREQLRALGQSLVPAARAGDFNQAMMELGALVCAPKIARLRRLSRCARIARRCGWASRPRSCRSSSRAPRAARWRSPARWSSAPAACCWCAGSRASCSPAPGRCRRRTSSTACRPKTPRAPPPSRRAWSRRRRRSFAGACATSSPTAISPRTCSRSASARVARIDGRRGATLGRARRAREPGDLQLHAQDPGRRGLSIVTMRANTGQAA